MKLKDYFISNGIMQKHLAKKIGIAENTLVKVIKGQDTRISIAYKIEKGTNGQVTMQDLAKNLKNPPVLNSQKKEG